MLYTHIWICGGPGWATTQVYPARFLPLVAFPAEDQHLKRITCTQSSTPRSRPPSQQCSHAPIGVPGVGINAINRLLQ